MSGVKQFLKSKQGLTFLALLITLALGIAIGTIVSDGVFSAEPKSQVAQLQIQGEGKPLVLDREFSLLEGFSRVAKTVEPTVVNINTSFIERPRVARRPERRPEREQDPFRDFGEDFWERFFGAPGVPRAQKITSLGSGIIVDSKGYILTNYHVVARAEKINVKLSSGETYMARVIGQDPETDVAVLTIDASRPLPFAKIGDTSKVQVGDWALAIGSPFGFAQTVTSGIVSATGRVVPQFSSFGDYIQTDAAINMGNSGGPLVNMRGEVIGINTFISTTSGGSEGVGFAIPSSVFVNSYNQIVTKGKVQRGWLGVQMNDSDFPFSEEMAQYFGVAGHDASGIKDGDGVLVTEIIDEGGKPAKAGPAWEAGIRPEDVIVKFGDREVESNFDLRSAVANTPPGKSVPIVVIRRGQVLNLSVTLAERTLEERTRAERAPQSLDEERQEPKKEIGLEVQTLSSQDAARLGLEDEKGVLILGVAPGSLADEAGLQPNRVVTHVNGDAVRSVQELKDKLNSVASGKGAILRLVYSQDGRKSIAYTSFVKP